MKFTWKDLIEFAALFLPAMLKTAQYLFTPLENEMSNTKFSTQIGKIQL